ncbi:uncharacterized protein At4g02000-like [Castanea sativa]|uniref:uncharacterized protein At4g02000-like n=1 Tax=Castanea sativa TaxID=21020 RepID=UPI003F64E950
MDADFIERLQSIHLMEEEDEVIKVQSQNHAKILEECSLSLMGRFHTTKPINLWAAKNLLRSVWKFGHDLKITNVDEGLMQFKFSMESRLKWEKGMTTFIVDFKVVPIWVQVWGLPLDLINEEARKDIGGGIGRVLEVDCKAIAAGQARFLRIRFELPLDKPIQRGALVLSPEGVRVQIAFQYERLVGLCFSCGKLRHEAKECLN